MEITEVRVRLVERKQDRLRAFCTVTLDDEFVIRDVKVIHGDRGLFVAMPSRKLTDRCPACRSKNQLRARYCSECGHRLRENRAQLDERGRPRLYVDIAHPINTEARERLEQAVLAAFQEEERRSEEPGYRPPRLYEDEGEEGEQVELLEGRAGVDQAPVAAPEPAAEELEAEPVAQELEAEPVAEEPEPGVAEPRAEEERVEIPPARPTPPPAAQKPEEDEHGFGAGIFDEE